ncbi:MAG: glycosyltransferase [Verrucomicrobiales bacterium]|jgi:glycosyltransferase involved in cell wall biosynthesis|nr:glycosyltransferase [Verrucomicrobiales bacterium]
MNISVCLATLNAEATLARCLDSARAVADEIVILDSGSVDRTPFIATEFNARFIHHTAADGDARARAAQKATRDWLLFLDAADELTPALQQELAALKAAAPAAGGCQINVIKNFGGVEIRFGKHYPDPQLRLVQKVKANFDVGQHLTVSGATPTLAGELIHHADPGLLHHPPPYRLLPALANHFFNGGLKHGALGWQVSKLDARK